MKDETTVALKAIKALAIKEDTIVGIMLHVCMIYITVSIPLISTDWCKVATTSSSIWVDDVSRQVGESINWI